MNFFGKKFNFISAPASVNGGKTDPEIEEIKLQFADLKAKYNVKLKEAKKVTLTSEEQRQLNEVETKFYFVRDRYERVIRRGGLKHIFFYSSFLAEFSSDQQKESLKRVIEGARNSIESLNEIILAAGNWNVFCFKII